MKRDISKTMFYNKDGSLNNYSLSCGYIEKSYICDISITLEKESSVYQVKGFNRNPLNYGRLFWETFDSNELVKARNYFFKMVKWYHGISKKQYLNNTI